jgi:hypothetical protein
VEMNPQSKNLVRRGGSVTLMDKGLCGRRATWLCNVCMQHICEEHVRQHTSWCVASTFTKIDFGDCSESIRQKP